MNHLNASIKRLKEIIIYSQYIEMENQIKNSTKKTKSYSLVYFGAGWNLKFLDDPTYKKFNHFILIDALPKLQHYNPDQEGYKKSKDKKSLIATIKKAADKYDLKLSSVRGNLLTFKKNEIKLEYYINTTIEEALSNPTIKRKLSKVIWVHEEGLEPYRYGLKVGDLPNLVEYRAKLREL